MQRTERRLDGAALFRNSKHQPNKVTVISEAHSFELTFPAPVCRVPHPSPLRYGLPRSRAECRGIHPCSQHGWRGEPDGKAKQSSLAREDLKVDLHFVLHLNHSATNTDGLDSKISLFENGVCRVRLAGLFHGQADRFGDTV